MIRRTTDLCWFPPEPSREEKRAFAEAFGRMDALDAWRRGELGNRLPPPPDLPPDALGTCLGCAVTPEANRCAGCPRPRAVKWLGPPASPAQEPKPRRSWKFWKRERD